MEELDLKQLFKIFWNKRLHIITIVLVFMLIGTVYSYAFVKPKYQAYTTLLLAQSDIKKDTEKVPGAQNTQTQGGITQSDLTLNQKLVATYSEFIKSNLVIDQVINELQLDMTTKELSKNIKVESVKDTVIIKITVTNEDPETTQKITKNKKRIKEIENGSIKKAS